MSLVFDIIAVRLHGLLLLLLGMYKNVKGEGVCWRLGGGRWQWVGVVGGGAVYKRAGGKRLQREANRITPPSFFLVSG